MTTVKVEIPRTIEGFRNWEFSSGSTIGEDFRAFARLFKRWLQGNIPEGAEIEVLKRGHYYMSGFVKREGKYVYFNVGDVRFTHSWATNILVRTAKSNTDWTGGMNQYTTLDRFSTDVDILLNR